MDLVVEEIGLLLLLEELDVADCFDEQKCLDCHHLAVLVKGVSFRNVFSVSRPEFRPPGSQMVARFIEMKLLTQYMHWHLTILHAADMHHMQNCSECRLE